jgi:hypothetical protein
MRSANGNANDNAGRSRLDAASLTSFHDQQMLGRDWPMLSHPPARSGIWAWINANHRYNGLLWREEERARRPDVPRIAAPDADAAGSRLVDRYRQKRDDATYAIDEALLAALRGVARQPGALLSSETAGAMIDRLSILALRIHAMRMAAQGAEAGPVHAACSACLDRLLAQRHDLGSCLDALLAGARAGRAYFKIYRQCRTYNDPGPSPYLNGPVRQGSGAAP